MKVNCRSTFGTRTRGRSNRFSLGSKDSVRLRSPPKVNKVH